MILIFKLFLVNLLIFAGVGVLNFVAGLLGLHLVIIVIVSFLSLVLSFIMNYILVFRPIMKLYNAVKTVDFDADKIDLTKIDTLQPSGFKQVKLVMEKTKYLVDIIAERINKINSTTYISEHDALSGCYNRIHLDAVKNNYEMQRSCVVIFIDVNNLKRMNDECGHEAGDALIRNAAAKLKFWDKYGDVYRVGGDEFMIVVCNQTQQFVENVISKWYPTVGLLNRESDGFKCVLSYGVASGSQYCNFDDVMKRADDLMYDMKVALKKKFGEPLR